MTQGKNKRGGPLVHLVGLVGVLFVGIAVAGLLGAFEPAAEIATEEFAVEAPDAMAADEEAQVTAPVAEEPVVEDTAVETGDARDVAQTDAPPQGQAVGEAQPYPLEVGRYWVYVSEDPERGTRTEVERRIVRRESRPDQDLFYFSDGTVAFRQDDKIFEMGPEGGVNVIPLGADPYVYRSQGLHIEKQIGNTDTVMILGGQRFAHCVQVITRFRPLDRPERESRAYASYYARGIGLVGRELWPPAPGGAPSQILRDYGPRKL